MNNVGQVFGKITLTFSIPVQNENETLALMEAYHKIDPDYMVDWKLAAIDCHGESVKLDVHNVENVSLDEIVNY